MTIRPITRENISFESRCDGTVSVVDRVVSEKSIVLCWAVLKWSVQSDRYGHVSISCGAQISIGSPDAMTDH